MKRYPWEPLEELLRARLGTEATDQDLARYIGVTHGAFRNWRSKGLTLITADRVAVQLGLMAWMIWPEWEAESAEWADARSGEPQTRVCAAEDCDTVFEVVWRGAKRKWCSDRCRRRQGSRVRRLDPEFCRKEKERKRVYNAESRRAINAKQRVRDQRRRAAA